MATPLPKNLEIYPILEIQAKKIPGVPRGLGVLCLRTKTGWQAYGATRRQWEDIARYCERVAKKLPDVRSEDIGPPTWD